MIRGIFQDVASYFIPHVEEKVSFSKLLQEGITEIHQLAVKNAFLQTIREGGGVFCSKGWVLYLCNLFVIHRSLEKAQENLKKTRGDHFFVFPALFKSKRILNDIKVWSIFNELDTFFAEKDCESLEFIKTVEALSEESAHAFAEYIEKMPYENPFFLLGILFALYGTTLSGGQQFKSGLKSGFKFRVVNDQFEGESTLKKELCEIANNESLLDKAADKCVQLFCLGPEEGSVQEFKQKWHQNLDEILNNEKFRSNQERQLWIDRVVEEANKAVREILNVINDTIITNAKPFKEILTERKIG